MWIGTLAPTILIGVLGNMPFITAIGIMCSVFDLIYIGMVWRARKQPEAFADAAPAAPGLDAAGAVDSATPAVVKPVA
jgi:predicted lipid-binding transport protein (Tim44 family)